MAQRQRSGTSGQVYLGHDLDTCGWKILSQEFFTETHDREYYEPLASCSRRARKRIQEGQVDQDRQKTQPEEAQKEKRRELGPLPPLLCRC
ncbi:junction-mediating and -regulatory protein-like [Vicugna pacos]|uniref:Junction-mediating and -regulatory protein-like n=1 Tax=Vicugna pacos TaxID=30538 RepID=A0ABM5CJC5_VICPA